MDECECITARRSTVLLYIMRILNSYCYFFVKLIEYEGDMTDDDLLR